MQFHSKLIQFHITFSFKFIGIKLTYSQLKNSISNYADQTQFFSAIIQFKQYSLDSSEELLLPCLVLSLIYLFHLAFLTLAWSQPICLPVHQEFSDIIHNTSMQETP